MNTQVEDLIIHLADGEGHADKFCPIQFYSKYCEDGEIHKYVKASYDKGNPECGQILNEWRLEKILQHAEKFEQGRREMQELKDAYANLLNALSEALSPKPTKLESSACSLFDWLASLFSRCRKQILEIGRI